MDSDVQQSPAAPRPDPTTLAEALVRINTTPDEAWNLAVRAKWGFVPDGSDPPYEYDQGDVIAVEYDSLYDLASAALAALRLLGAAPPE